MKEQEWDNSQEGFMNRVGLIMSGICPKCKGLTIVETLTDQVSQEWTITCSGCDYVMVFDGV
jgi:hypothetical protein